MAHSIGIDALSSLRERLKALLANPSAARMALSARLTHGAVTLGALVLLLWRMPAYQQGFFFSFLSLGTFFQVGELGLTGVLVQSSSHYRTSGKSGGLEKLWSTSLQIALIANAATALVVGALGFLLFRSASVTTAADTTTWQLPWLAYVAATAAGQVTLAMLAFLEGGMSAAKAWRLQRDMELQSGFIFLPALAAGMALWSLPLLAFARFLAAAVWLTKHRAYFPDTAAPASWSWWRSNILPFQWRIALSALAFFMLFRAFNPMVFAKLGPVEASRFGLSWSIMTMLMTIFTVWPASQIAYYSQLITQHDLSQLQCSFRAMFFRSTALTALACLAVLLAFVVFQQIVPSFANRFADIETLALLLASALAQHVIACFAALLRSEGRDPLLPLSIGGAAITFAACSVATTLGGMQSLALSYLLCTTLGLPYCYVLYLRFTRRDRPAWVQPQF